MLLAEATTFEGCVNTIARIEVHYLRAPGGSAGLAQGSDTVSEVLWPQHRCLHQTFSC